MLRKPKILVVGSFVMDLIASTRRAPCCGESVVGESFRTAPGGKGADQAVQCARLGAEVTMVGCVGADIFGRELLETVRAAGVDVSRVAELADVFTGVGHLLLETGDGETKNRITYIPGANMGVTLAQVSWLETAIGGYDMVLLQLEIPMEVNLVVARWAKAAGVPVMLNPAPAAVLPEELLACVTYLSPNEHEAAALTGLPLRTDETAVNRDDVARAAAALRGMGAAQVIITLGCHGSAALTEEGLHFISSVRMAHVADPTGAGDSFVGAFCTGLSAGLTMAQAGDFASHAAALTVSRMGAMPSLPTLAEVRALMGQRAYVGIDDCALCVLE